MDIFSYIEPGNAPSSSPFTDRIDLTRINFLNRPFSISLNDCQTAIIVLPAPGPEIQKVISLSLIELMNSFYLSFKHLTGLACHLTGGSLYSSCCFVPIFFLLLPISSILNYNTKLLK
jgi:hypothetical protein